MSQKWQFQNTSQSQTKLHEVRTSNLHSCGLEPEHISQIQNRNRMLIILSFRRAIFDRRRNLIPLGKGELHHWTAMKSTTQFNFCFCFFFLTIEWCQLSRWSQPASVCNYLHQAMITKLHVLLPQNQNFTPRHWQTPVHNNKKKG